AFWVAGTLLPLVLLHLSRHGGNFSLDPLVGVWTILLNGAVGMAEKTRKIPPNLTKFAFSPSLYSSPFLGNCPQSPINFHNRTMTSDGDVGRNAAHRGSP